jgi:hypothetical protein
MGTRQEPSSSTEIPGAELVQPTWRGLEVVVGMVLLILGGVLTLTGYFAIVGIPMVGFGLILLLRGFMTSSGRPTT